MSPNVPSALAANPPARSIAPTRTRETPIIITVMPATVGVMILRRNGMIRLPAMTTNPPMKHTPKRVDSACSHDMPCSFIRGDAQRARDDGGRCHDAEHHGQNVLEGGQQGRTERRMGLEAVNQFAFFFRIGRSGLRGRGAGHRHPPEAWGWEIFAGKTSGDQPRPRAISSGVVPFLTEIRFPCTVE